MTQIIANDNMIDAETVGVIDNRVTICVLRMASGNYVVGYHCPTLAEVFNPLTGQRLATSDAHAKLRRGEFAHKNGLTPNPPVLAMEHAGE